MSDICPCKNCDIRYIGCHSECAAYNFWRSETAKVNDYIKAQKEKEYILDKVKRCGIDRIKRSKRHGH